MAKITKISRKAARKQIEKKLEITFSPLESILGSKNFKRRIKVAGKALIKGLKNKESQLALASLEKLKVPKGENEPHKKDGMKGHSPQVTAHAKKAIEPTHN